MEQEGAYARLCPDCRTPLRTEVRSELGMQASALGCCMSAIAVQTIGNRPVGLDQVKEFFYQRTELIDAV